jgi:hypothetical protein
MGSVSEVYSIINHALHCYASPGQRELVAAVAVVGDVVVHHGLPHLRVQEVNVRQVLVPVFPLHDVLSDGGQSTHDSPAHAPVDGVLSASVTDNRCSMSIFPE